MITINTRDPKPIYEQITENFRRLILSGVMVPDERLPSVRELAQQLAINPNTIQRAYRELESGGYTYSIPGRGSFVSATRKPDTARKNELLRTMQEALRELRLLGVADEEIRESLKSEENANG